MGVRKLILVFLLISLFAACESTPKKESQFTLLNASETGVDFVNEINDTAAFNILDYLYYYNGGGVAIGDINNDGWADIFFSSNRGKNKLYLNKGNLKFEDITEKAGISGKGNWKTGVTMADVNGDGWLDIYVSEVGGYKSLKGKNELFINNKNLSFSEEATRFGLDIEGFNTQAVFFDYDRDNDLDVFIVNHSVHSNESYGDSSLRSRINWEAGDKLFRNDSTISGRYFKEVTQEAGIISSVLGYGLNVMTADLNNDGWIDIYVSNDFHENDYYYLNKGNGSFVEMNRSAFGHESRFSMGSDIADINNDGWLDIFTLDMLPESEFLLKTATGDDPLDIYDFKHDLGYHHQYSRNSLQLNVGKGKKFADIGLYAGVSATDWSWSPLIADFDNDGIKDIFVSNGILRRPNDLDFLKFTSNRKANEVGRTADIQAIGMMPEGKVSNKIFKGSDSLVFSDQTKSWGMDIPSFSNGTATADLDNDGDLDLVVNNINQTAFIYKNNTERFLQNHYLSISPEGTNQNKAGVGTKVIIKHAGKTQLNFLSPTRGFESGSLQYIHFGLGKDSIVDEIIAIWPEGDSSFFYQVKSDQVFRLKKGSGKRVQADQIQVSESISFNDISEAVGLDFRHQENKFSDFNAQPLIPHQLSTSGPRVAVADVNADGKEDFYIGGASGQPGKLFIQTKTSTFVSTNELLFAADSLCEDIEADFFDADKDGDLDLLVISGGNQYPTGSKYLIDRFYLNDGNGAFRKSNDFPFIPVNKSCATLADIDSDGDIDLFMGVANETNRYGQSAESYLLINDGKGLFTERKDILADLKKPGIIQSAKFFDVDGDKDPDLVVAGEWMAPTVFINDKGNFTRRTGAILPFSGWWQSILPVDIDSDGDMDFVAGNWGLNSKLRASEQDPLMLFDFDYDNNGTREQLLTYSKEGKRFPFLGKDELEKQIPSIKKEFLRYADFAGKTVEEIFGDRLTKASVYKAADCASAIFINDGKGNFSRKALPIVSQMAPLFASVALDFNEDGLVDLLTAGNFYGVLPYEGRYDAMMPALLTGQRGGGFYSNWEVPDALQIDGEIRDLKPIQLANGKKCLIVARNNDRPVFLTWKK